MKVSHMTLGIDFVGSCVYAEAVIVKFVDVH